MLRISPAVPVGLPRVVPSSGTTIAGVSIPAGVRVSFPRLLFCALLTTTPQTVVSQSPCLSTFPSRSSPGHTSSCPNAGYSRNRKRWSVGWSPSRRVLGVVLASSKHIPELFYEYPERNRTAWHIASCISPSRIYSVTSTFAQIWPSKIAHDARLLFLAEYELMLVL
jgi:hypothetical protein